MRRLIELKVIFIFFGIIFLFTNMAFAVSLPIPARTEVIREETVEQSGQEYKMLFCESDLSQDEVTSFYEKKLTAEGYSLFLNIDTMRMYKKEAKTFLIAVGSNPEGKTNIVLTQGGGLAALGKAAQSSIPVDCGELPNVPVYPGARCLASTRMKESRSTVHRYSAAAEAAHVSDFYRQQMPQYGWHIENEVDMSQVLSGREEIAGAGAVGLNFEGAAQISFKNNLGIRCMITVMPAGMGSGSVINIIYNESEK